MTTSLEFGEIFLCHFPFTNLEAGKKRPSLVIFDFGRDVLICRITSVFHKEPLDLEIKDWQESGLLKPSIARLSRLVTIEKSLLLKKMGKLGEHDRSRISSEWNRCMKL